MRFHYTVSDCRNKLDVFLELIEEELRNWQVVHWMLKQQNPKNPVPPILIKLHELLQGPRANGEHREQTALHIARSFRQSIVVTGDNS